MARDGLSEEECAEVLDDLRRHCPTIDDELLLWLAQTFALEAMVDFDSNDLVALLNRPGEKIVRREMFAPDVSPPDALKTLLFDDERRLIDEGRFSGGLLILRLSAELTNRYWPARTGEMMGLFRKTVGPHAEAIYGVLVDEKVPAGSELFVLLDDSRIPESD